MLPSVIWMEGTNDGILEACPTTFQKLEERAPSIANVDKVTISLSYDDLKVPLVEGNFKCLSQFQSPIFLEITADDVNAADNSEESHSEPGQVEINLNETVNAVDLSMVNKSISQSRMRWTDEEKAYLRNFHKYILVKDIKKPDLDDFARWLSKRKVTKDILFGGRSTSAVMGQYKKYVTIGEFSDVKKATKKKN